MKTGLEKAVPSRYKTLWRHSLKQEERVLDIFWWHQELPIRDCEEMLEFQKVFKTRENET